MHKRQGDTKNTAQIPRDQKGTGPPVKDGRGGRGHEGNVFRQREEMNLGR